MYVCLLPDQAICGGVLIPHNATESLVHCERIRRNDYRNFAANQLVNKESEFALAGREAA